MIQQTIVAYASAFVPIGILMLLLNRADRKFEATKSPLSHRLLRPPGESCRIQIEELTSQLMDSLIIFLLFSCALGYFAWIAFSVPVIWSFYTLGLMALGGFSFRLRNKWKERQNYILGFLGERAVGEELNQLLSKGWRVFHDVQFDDNPGGKPFNIDHIVAGPGGVFVVETKTRRKRVLNSREEPKNEVHFDGKTLHYPWGNEDFGLKHAENNAGYLADWLSRSLKSRIEVTPVLALPGWMVHRRAKSAVRVVSGREICKIFPDLEKSSPILPEVQAHAICALLEQKNRDVS